MRVENIIWDWNGTIVDDAWVFVSIMNGFLKNNNLPSTSLVAYRKNFCFPIQDYWKNLGFQFNKKDFDRLNKDFISEYQKKLFSPKLHRGIKSLLHYIKKQNVNQFVLSASEQSILNKSINYYNIQNVFKGIFGVDNLNATGKELLGKKLCLKYKLNNRKTLLIGDTEYDWRVAQELGCQVILIACGHINYIRLKKTGSLVLENIYELKKHMLINL